jgi:general secretion pathway protein M
MSAPMDALRARWAAFAPREKAMVAVAAAVVGLALVWMIFIGPALATLHTADEQRRTLDTQIARMLAMQTQAQAMQSQPKVGRDETIRQLELSVRQRLGTTARTMISGDRVTVTLTGAPADTLAQWLSQVRAAAHALPAEAHMNRNANGTWEGTIVLALPRS